MSPEEIRRLIAESLGVPVETVRDDLAFGDIPEWDSLPHVELMLALEERLNVEIGPDEIVELASVELIIEFACSPAALRDRATTGTDG